MAEVATTLDEIYGKRVKLYQPAKGFRVCVDTILLSASIDAQPNNKVLDVGAGVGGATLALAARCPDIFVHGIELLRENVVLATENIKMNAMQGRVEILCGTLTTPPPRLAAGTYDHIMTNPPYYDGCSTRSSEITQKQLAHEMNDTEFKNWLQFCLMMLKTEGYITFIYPAHYLHKILGHLSGKMGNITIYPIWPKRNTPAKRVIIKGQKGSSAPSKILPGLTLHQVNGGYTQEAEEILRYGKGIEL